jgi:transcriptional regulator with PAS, ATPase and Fis domain
MAEAGIHSKNVKFLLEKLGIVGDSELFEHAVQTLLQVAPTDLAVLILGSTGTGKEVFANACHKLSKRSKSPFVSVNCAAIPETLLESELFGYEKGAFTGANDRRIGFFESANKGTLFLDEIGDMALATQAKLLRILESGEFTRLGSSEIRKVDVRIIAATNHNLEKEVLHNNFRQDLYYRLNTVKILLPSLKDRIEDLPMLFDYFANLTAETYNFTFEGISADAIDTLKKLSWNGNVRELRNFADKVVTLEKGKFITLPTIHKYLPPALPSKTTVFDDTDSQLMTSRKNDEFKNFETALLLKALFQIESKIELLNEQNSRILNEIEELKQEIYQIPRNNFYSVQPDKSDDELLTSLEDLNIEKIEKELIKLALFKFNGNRKKAAEALGISIRTFYRKLQQYSLD